MTIERGTWHPWREARARNWLEIRFGDVGHTTLAGCINGRRIQMADDLTQAERRCTIAHELVHDERRVYPRDAVLRAREETAVHEIAARRLIELEDLIDVLRWARHAAEVADELWVDVPTLLALVRSLTDDEREWIDEQLEDRPC